MPLLPGVSNIRPNIHEMVAAGHPVRQAVAAALHKAHPRGGHAGGGTLGAPPRLHRDTGGVMPQVPWMERQEARGEAATGFVHMGTPGRTDVLPVSPAAGSYVVPADVVAGLGQDNSMAGATTIQRMLATGPGGIPFQRFGHGNNIPRPPPPYNLYGGTTHTTGSGFGFAFGGEAVPHVTGPHVPNIPAIGHMSLGHMGIHPEHLHMKIGGAAKHEPKETVSYDHDGNVPVLIAGGEFVIPPDIVRDHPLIGNGDLRRGHAVLDKWVVHERGKHIKTLAKLPPPKK